MSFKVIDKFFLAISFLGSLIVYSVIFCAILVCCVNPWPPLLCNNLLGYCTCTAIILAYKIMCSQKLYVSGIHVAG